MFEKGMTKTAGKKKQPYDTDFWKNYKGQDRGYDEPSLWYGRYLVYRNLGSQRSITRANEMEWQEKKKRGQTKAQAAPKVTPKWREAQMLYRWDIRAAEFDSIQARAEEVVLLQARADLRKDEYTIAHKLKERALEILSMNLTERIVERVERDANGRPTVNYITIKPVRASLADAIKAMETFSKLGRMSLDMTSNNVRIEGDISMGNLTAGAQPSFMDGILEDPELADLAYEFMERVQDRKRKQILPAGSESDEASDIIDGSLTNNTD